MNDEVLTDLKQFIETTMSLQLAPVIERLDKLENRMDNLEQKVDDGFKSIGDLIKTVNEVHDKDQTENNRRLTALEQKTV